MMLSNQRHELSEKLIAIQPESLWAMCVIFKLHMFLGMSIFFIFPFTRLVHVWSGFGTLAYLVRLYQVVRSRRLSVRGRARQHARERSV